MIRPEKLDNAQTSTQHFDLADRSVPATHKAVTMPRWKACACTTCAAHDGSCPELTQARRCPACASAYEQQRGSRQARGYDAGHDRLREDWRPKVERGQVDCARCTRRILPGQPWALDHTDDRTGYLGPSHSTCNNRAGGQAAHP